MNINEIKENFHTLGIELQLFFTLVLVADENGAIKVKKSDLAKYLRTSAQTVGKYLKVLASCNILKYKYSGDGIFNPSFYYVGKEESKVAVLRAYANFKSDI